MAKNGKKVRFLLKKQTYLITNVPKKVFDNKHFRQAFEVTSRIKVDFNSFKYCDKKKKLIKFYVELNAEVAVEDIYAIEQIIRITKNLV